MRLERPFLLAFFFVLATVPLLFGARHPLIHALYSCLLLAVGGSLLAFNVDPRKRVRDLLSFSRLAPLLIILVILLSAVNLPLSLVEMLSPVRAGYLGSAIRHAELESAVTSLSYYAPGSMFYAVYGLALVLFFHAARSVLGAEGTVRATLWLVTLVGVVEAGYGLLQATNPSLGVLWLPGSVGAEGAARGTIIYRNQYAAFLNLCWPMALALGMVLSRTDPAELEPLRAGKVVLPPINRLSFLFRKATVPLWSAGLMILAVVFSRSRGGILVMLGIAALFIALLPFSRRLKGLSAALMLLFVIVYGGAIGFGEVIDRFAYLYDSALSRFGLWAASLAMLRDHLLTGIGMGGYELLSPVYLKDVKGTVWFDRAHNEYVELAVELGLPAMLLFLAWAGRGIVGYGAQICGKKGIQSAPAEMKAEDLVATGAFCALAGFLLHAWLDFVWRLPANVIYAVAILALLSASLMMNTKGGHEDPVRVH